MDERGKKFKKTFQRPDEAVEEFEENIRKSLRGKSKEEMKNILQQNDSDLLRWLTEIVLPYEDYEICQVAKEILKERNEEL